MGSARDALKGWGRESQMSEGSRGRKVKLFLVCSLRRQYHQWQEMLLILTNGRILKVWQSWVLWLLFRTVCSKTYQPFFHFKYDATEMTRGPECDHLWASVSFPHPLPVSGISYPPPHSPGNPDRTDSNLHSHPEPKMGRDPGLQVSDSFCRGHRIQITPMSSAPKTWEALFLLRGFNRTVVLPGLLGTKLTEESGKWSAAFWQHHPST